MARRAHPLDCQCGGYGWCAQREQRARRGRTAASVIAAELADSLARDRDIRGTGALPGRLDPDPDAGSAVAVAWREHRHAYGPVRGHYCLGAGPDGGLYVWPWHHPDPHLHPIGDG